MVLINCVIRKFKLILLPDGTRNIFGVTERKHSCTCTKLEVKLISNVVCLTKARSAKRPSLVCPLFYFLLEPIPIILVAICSTSWSSCANFNAPTVGTKWRAVTVSPISDHPSHAHPYSPLYALSWSIHKLTISRA